MPWTSASKLNEWMIQLRAPSSGETREFIRRATLTVHYGDSLAVECTSVVHVFLRCIVGLNECTRKHPLWFRTPLKMAVPSNSALFEGIGGDFGYSLCELIACCFGKGRGNTETQSKLFANHNALGQLTNHNTFRFSVGGTSSNPELIEPFVPGWGERYCNYVNYVKNNAIFEPPSMRACSSTPSKQNQDFVKEHIGPL